MKDLGLSGVIVPLESPVFETQLQHLLLLLELGHLFLQTLNLPLQLCDLLSILLPLLENALFCIRRQKEGRKEMEKQRKGENALFYIR